MSDKKQNGDTKVDAASTSKQADAHKGCAHGQHCSSIVHSDLPVKNVSLYSLECISHLHDNAHCTGRRTPAGAAVNRRSL